MFASCGNFCVGARIVAAATAWVHRGSVQLANTTIAVLALFFLLQTMRAKLRDERRIPLVEVPLHALRARDVVLKFVEKNELNLFYY